MRAIDRLIFLLMALGAANQVHAQAPVDHFGFLEQWQILSEDVRLGKVMVSGRGLAPGYDAEIDKLSDEGHFKVSIGPEQTPAPFNQIHTWLIRIEGPDGAPAKGAVIDVYGGMPLHNHAFPTAPRIANEIEDGVYALEGVKFSMTGWWAIGLGIEALGESDRVDFNLIIDP
jgi:hypothetical protein